MLNVMPLKNKNRRIVISKVKFYNSCSFKVFFRKSTVNDVFFFELLLKYVFFEKNKRKILGQNGLPLISSSLANGLSIW